MAPRAEIKDKVWGRPRYFGLRDIHDAVLDGENQCL
jgi:hypothetical protein